MSRFRSVARAGAVVGAASVASRVLGFLRDVLIAQVLGAGAVADAFLAAFRISNLFRRVLGEGGLNAGFVPVYGDMAAREGPEAARRFAGRTIVNALFFFVALTGVAELAAGGLVLTMAAGFVGDEDKLALAVFYTRLSLPFIAFTGLASLLAALLNAERRFAAAAVAPALVNAVLIAILLLPGSDGADDPAAGAWLALAVSLSGLLHLAIVAGAVARMPGRPPLPAPRLDADARRLIRFALPALAASGMTQVILLTATALASAQPSAVSWLYYADRVFQLPLSFIGVAAGVVLLPEFVGRTREDARQAGGALAAYLTGALALALPAAAGLAALAGTIVSVLFERGAFAAADREATGALLAALALGLPAAAASKVLIQPFFARRSVRPPLAAGLAGMLATVGGAYLLPLSGNGAIGLAASLGLWAQALALAGFGRADVDWRRLAAFRPARLAGAAALMGAVVAAADTLAAPWLAADKPLVLRGAILAALCAGGMLAYGAAARVLAGREALARWRGGESSSRSD